MSWVECAPYHTTTSVFSMDSPFTKLWVPPVLRTPTLRRSSPREGVRVPGPHPPEFRRRAIELVRERTKPFAHRQRPWDQRVLPAQLGAPGRRRRGPQGRPDHRRAGGAHEAPSRGVALVAQVELDQPPEQVGHLAFEYSAAVPFGGEPVPVHDRGGRRDLHLGHGGAGPAGPLWGCGVGPDDLADVSGHRRGGARCAAPGPGGGPGGGMGGSLRPTPGLRAS